MGVAVEVDVSERQRAILEKWVRNKADTAARLVERCRIILMSADGVSNAEQGRRLEADPQRPRRWRKRWAAACGRLEAAEVNLEENQLLTCLTRRLPCRPWVARLANSLRQESRGPAHDGDALLRPDREERCS